MALNGAVPPVGVHGDYARAARDCDEEQILSQGLGDLDLMWWAVTKKALLPSRVGQPGLAHARIMEALSLARAAGQAELERIADLWIGDMALVQALHEEAAEWYGKALAFFLATNWSWGLVDASDGPGGVHFATGNLVQAMKHDLESLELAWRHEVPVMAIGPLIGLAGVVAESGAAEQGARIPGAAEGLSSLLGPPSSPRDRPARDHALATLTALPGDAHLEALRDAGRSLTFELAVSEARAVADQVRR